MLAETGALIGWLFVSPVWADEPPPSIELLELLGQWQELTEMGVDIDTLMEDQADSTLREQAPEKEAAGS